MKEIINKLLDKANLMISHTKALKRINTLELKLEIVTNQLKECAYKKEILEQKVKKMKGVKE